MTLEDLLEKYKGDPRLLGWNCNEYRHASGHLTGLSWSIASKITGLEMSVRVKISRDGKWQWYGSVHYESLEGYDNLVEVPVLHPVKLATLDAALDWIRDSLQIVQKDVERFMVLAGGRVANGDEVTDGQN